MSANDAPVAARANAATASGDEISAGKSFRDCPEAEQCPEMLTIPAAPDGVLLGSPEDEPGRIDNEALHRVRVAAFAIGKYEVSVAEYLACADAKSCPPPEWRDPNSPHDIQSGTGFYYRNLGAAITDPKQPVVGVSHTDAVAYTKWLSKKTGQTYRLPSESEWEYAARAGAATAYWWGTDHKNSDGSPRAHCRGCSQAADGKAAVAVTSLAPNAWGLHNVHGNVWEWVAGYYCADQALAPTDGSARTTDDCPFKEADDLRVFRGGSSFYGPEKMRAASRLRNYSTLRNFSIGFRVARSQ